VAFLRVLRPCQTLDCLTNYGEASFTSCLETRMNARFLVIKLKMYPQMYPQIVQATPFSVVVGAVPVLACSQTFKPGRSAWRVASLGHGLLTPTPYPLRGCENDDKTTVWKPKSPGAFTPPYPRRVGNPRRAQTASARRSGAVVGAVPVLTCSRTGHPCRESRPAPDAQARSFSVADAQLRPWLVLVLASSRAGNPCRASSHQI
jgi:hypothetical protein